MINDDKRLYELQKTAKKKKGNIATLDLHKERRLNLLHTIGVNKQKIVCVCGGGGGGI